MVRSVSTRKSLWSLPLVRRNLVDKIREKLRSIESDTPLPFMDTERLQNDSTIKVSITVAFLQEEKFRTEGCVLVVRPCLACTPHFPSSILQLGWSSHLGLLLDDMLCFTAFVPFTIGSFMSGSFKCKYTHYQGCASNLELSLGPLATWLYLLHPQLIFGCKHRWQSSTAFATKHKHTTREKWVIAEV